MSGEERPGHGLAKLDSSVDSDGIRASVVLAYAHSFELASVFADSVFRTYEYERHHGEDRLWRTLGVNAGAMQLDRARNGMVSMFLDQTDREWLWMVDSDMGFASDSLEQLQTSAVANDVEIISGLYYGRYDGSVLPNGALEFVTRPQVYTWIEERKSFGQVDSGSEIPANTLLSVDGTGAGCMLIRRSLLIRMKERFGTWFDLIVPDPTNTSTRISEDLSFCLRARLMDTPIVVHTGVRLAHQKPAWI